MVRGLKKLTHNGNTTLTLGLDIGYGATKAVTDDQTVVFPSVAGYARDIKFKAEELTLKHPGDQLRDDEGDWFIGDLAQSQLTAGEQLSLRGRTADETALGNAFRLRLAKAALGKLRPDLRNGDVVHVNIATGLPVDHMRDAAKLKEALLGQQRIKTDITDFVANITDVMVMPQPYGTIYRHMMTVTGALSTCHTYDRTGVVDVGRYTVDFAYDRDGEYIDSLSGSVEAGVWTVQERLATDYETDYREKPSLRDVDAILRTGCFKVSGEAVDYTKQRLEAIEPLIAATLNKMGQLWQTGATLDVIYVAGGGAGLVFDAIKRVYPQAVLTDDAQVSNARGYLNYAHFAAES